jgi:hypothetical protein
MCTGQRPVKSLQKVMMSMASRVLDESKEYNSKKIVESMIASKELDHSLGGRGLPPSGALVTHPMKDKKKGKIFLFKQVVTRKDKTRSKYF